jgi:hypothetical protein
MRVLRSTRVLVSQVLESFKSSAVSVRSGRSTESVWISLGVVSSAVQLIRSVVVRVPVLWESFPLWKDLESVRARAWRSGTAVGCVRVQLKEWVERRPSCGFVG